MFQKNKGQLYCLKVYSLSESLFAVWKFIRCLKVYSLSAESLFAVVDDTFRNFFELRFSVKLFEKLNAVALFFLIFEKESLI